jgi:LacI family transcriptional regulator
MRSDIPIVVVDMDSANCSVVYSDNIEGARLAVNYLYELGHRKIAHIAGDETIDAGAARIKGYELAMQELNLPIRPGYLVNAGFFSVGEGKQAMERLLELDDQPTAVFVAGDQMAIGVIEAIHEHGLHVPNDISVIGYDDIEMIQYITPKLTTIRQDTDEIGEAAAELLLEQMTAKERLTERRIIPVRLVERASCAPVKQ